MKRLPKVFVNPISKDFQNNEKVFYGNEVLKPVDVSKKLRSIFQKNRHSYKIDVVITTKDGTFSKQLIGRTKTTLLTIENEQIPIQDILDIEIKKQ